MRMRISGLLFAIATLAAACSGGSPGGGGDTRATKVPAPTTTKVPAPTTTKAPRSPDVSTFAAEACAGSSYERCTDSVAFMLGLTSAGTTLAICEYGSGQGDVVIVEEGDTAEAACSADGLISPSEVFATVEVP